MKIVKADLPFIALWSIGAAFIFSAMIASIGWYAVPVQATIFIGLFVAVKMVGCDCKLFKTAQKNMFQCKS